MGKISIFYIISWEFCRRWAHGETEQDYTKAMKSIRALCNRHLPGHCCIGLCDVRPHALAMDVHRGELELPRV